MFEYYWWHVHLKVVGAILLLKNVGLLFKFENEEKNQNHSFLNILKMIK